MGSHLNFRLYFPEEMGSHNLSIPSTLCRWNFSPRRAPTCGLFLPGQHC